MKDWSLGVMMLTEPQVYAFLDYIRSLPADDIVKRRTIINIFVNAVYLYDDHFKLIINASKHPLQEKEVPLSEIETALEDSKTSWYNSSVEALDAPPKEKTPI